MQFVRYNNNIKSRFESQIIFTPINPMVSGILVLTGVSFCFIAGSGSYLVSCDASDGLAASFPGCAVVLVRGLVGSLLCLTFYCKRWECFPPLYVSGPCMHVSSWSLRWVGPVGFPGGFGLVSRVWSLVLGGGFGVWFLFLAGY